MGMMKMPTFPAQSRTSFFGFRLSRVVGMVPPRLKIRNPWNSLTEILAWYLPDTLSFAYEIHYFGFAKLR